MIIWLIYDILKFSFFVYLTTQQLKRSSSKINIKISTPLFRSKYIGLITCVLVMGALYQINTSDNFKI